MENKNGKNLFSDDDFEDIFSSSPEGDGFEDICSDSGEADRFEDVFSGREAEESAPQTDDPYAGFFTDFPEDLQPREDLPRARVNTAPEKKPYSYNYNDRETPRTRARNGDEIYSGADADGASPRRTPKKKKHIGLRIFAVLLVLLLLFVGGAGLYGYASVKKVIGKVDYAPLKANAYIADSELLHADYLKNILLIGVDAREGEDAEKTRSDTMMLVTIDTRNNQIKLTSFLRDMYLEIPGYREDKLNAAQSRGGTQLLVDTLEYNFKIRIDNYMFVSFEMFTTIIDKLGGIDVEITEKEAKYINSKDHMALEDVYAFPEKLSGGMQHFTGAQALWYSRIRYLDSDFMRTARQRKVISALVRKATQQSPAELFELVGEVMPLVRTDLTEDEIMNLGLHALSYLQYAIVQQQIPAQDAYKSGTRRSQSVLLPDMEKNRSVLKTFVFEKAAAEETEAKK